MAQFDPTPSIDDVHYEGDVKWIFDGRKWVKQVPTIKTEDIELSDPSHPANVFTTPQVVPDVPVDTTSQLDANRYFVNALGKLDDFVRGIHVSDSPPAEYRTGTLWWDSSPDKLTLFMYYDPDNNPLTAAWIEASPPTSLDGINATIADALLVQDDLVSRVGTGESKQGALETTVNNALTTQGNIQSNLGTLDTTVSDALVTQGTIQADIVELENKVAALEGTVTDAQYILSARPDNLPMGQFQIYDSVGNETIQWNLATSIVFHNSDNQAVVHSFDNVGLEDLMRIGGTVGSAVYRIKSAKNPDGNSNTYSEFFIEYVSSADLAVQGIIYDFEFTPGFDPGAYATKSYVDDADALKVNKSGDTITGKLILSASGQANDDGVRLYMKDNTNTTNLTIFPSGLLQSSNTIRVNKDTGDAYQLKDATGSTVKYKVSSDGHVESPKLKLTGGGSANADERVIDVQSGIAGRLAYNGKTRLTWGNASVWIGTSDGLGETVESINLNLQGNNIDNVGAIKINATDKTTTVRPFVIRGTLEDGTDDSQDFFYYYANTGAGSPDAMNYRGKMSGDYNLVNKSYVDTAIAGVDTSGAFLPLTGGELTGTLTLNNSSNQQINFAKTGNNDIQYQGTWLISLQGDTTPKIKIAGDLDANQKFIANVHDPVSAQDAVNLRSLQGAKVTATSSGATTAGGFYQSGGKLFYKTM